MRALRAALSAFLVGALSLSAAPTHAQLFGPGKFKIEKTVDRFATDGLFNITGKNNRVSKKSPAGGIYIDAGGVYLEPDAVIRQSDGQLVSLALLIHNETESDTLVGRPNSLGMLRQITFIIDGGNPVAFPIRDSANKVADTVQYNSITHSASSAISERGLITLTREQFRQIANASTIAVKLEGSDRAIVFNERDISKNFLPNLRTFEAALPPQK
jgi:hypothetical protein